MLHKTVVLLALLALVAALRMFALDADPPGDMHIHFITDEGWWAHNARQRALFGRWIMDEHNPPLYTAPVHSYLLWLAYEAFGVGLWQTRLLSAISGVLTCALVWLFVRQEDSRRSANWCALLLGTSYFLLSYNRTAFTESLQLLFVTAAILGAVRARKQPALGALSGLSLLAALLVKSSALVAAPVVAGCLAAQLLDRSAAPSERRVRWRGALAASAAFLLGALTVWLLLVQPNLAEVLREFQSNVQISVWSSGQPHQDIKRLLWFGIREDVAGLETRVLNGFFTQCAALVLVVAALAAARLLGTRPLPARWLEGTCWLWVGTSLGLLATQGYQPDRRFLVLLPPLVILASLHLSTGRPASREPQAPPPGRGRWLRRIGAWLIVGLVIGIYARLPLLPSLLAWTADLSFGADPGLGSEPLLALIWGASLVLGVAVVEATRVMLRPAGWRLLGPLVLAVVAGIDLARFGAHLAEPRFTVRDASRAIGEVVERLGPERNAVVGHTADTLCLENRAFSFLIRDWPRVDMHMNLDGIERFAPGFAIETRYKGVLAAGPNYFEVSEDQIARVFGAWNDAGGRSRLELVLYALDEEAAQAAAEPR